MLLSYFCSQNLESMNYEAIRQKEKQFLSLTSLTTLFQKLFNILTLYPKEDTYEEATCYFKR